MCLAALYPPNVSADGKRKATLFAEEENITFGRPKYACKTRTSNAYPTNRSDGDRYATLKASYALNASQLP